MGNKLSIHCTGCVFNINDNCLRYADTQIPCRFEEAMRYAMERDIYEQLCRECEKRRNNKE